MMRSLREFAAFFRSDLKGDLAPELRAAQREVILARTVVLIWISVVVMPTTILSYVYFIARERFPIAVWIVGSAIGLVLFHRLLVAKGVYEKHYHVAMLLLVGGVFGPTGTAIVEITRSSQGDFFFAFFLIYFAFTSLFPADVGWVLATSGAIIGSYVAGRLFRPEGLIFDANLTSNIIYLVELTFIGVVLNRVLCKLFFDEKKSRIELAKANEGLRELDKAKTSFFSNISHEIRTPLTLILTPISHILQTQSDRLSPDLKAKLEGIRGNANRLLKMVNSLLDFAKLESGQVKVHLVELSIDDVLRYAGGLFAGTAENKGIALKVVPETQGLMVEGDLDKLEKILVNLMGNAIKFTPRGGTITVRSRSAGDMYELVVSDTGVGIPKEQQRAVFQRFTQLENSNQASVRGTGIGLSMVQEYAKLLGGEVLLESEPSKGSTFTVRLPVKVTTPAERADAAPAREVSTKPRPADEAELVTADIIPTDRSAPEIREIDNAGEGKPRVLVVDDNPALVSLVSSILESEYNLFLANSAREALRHLEKKPVDLVVSDVMMPGISGLELCRRIKTTERTKHLPVVLLTARGGTMQKVEGLEHGADDYIGKPFDPEELKARIRSLFDLRKTTSALAVKSTELEQALGKLKEEELKVVESEKMRTLGEIAAGVLHELHNCLNMIINGATPLKEGLVELEKTVRREPSADLDMSELTELADLVLTAAASAREVTGELKGFAHQDSHAGKPVDIHAVIQSTVRMFGRPQGLTVALDFVSGPLVVNGVSNRFTQVFTNLLKNAFEATGGTGKVTIATRCDGPNAVISVTDSGPGVSAAARAKLFEPFQTTKKQGEGLGLGLSISRKVVHDFGGELRLDESHSPGARFVITLPLLTGARTEPKTTEVPRDLGAN